MKDKVYLFGAYMGLHTNGNKGWGNFLLEFPSMPSYEDLKESIKKRQEITLSDLTTIKITLSDLAIINLQFLTKEQFYALKGEEKQETPQSDLLNKKIAECDLSIRVKNICKQNGLNTVRDVCRLAKTDWLKFHNGGKMSLSEVDNFLKYYGLDWGMNV